MSHPSDAASQLAEKATLRASQPCTAARGNGGAPTRKRAPAPRAWLTLIAWTALASAEPALPTGVSVGPEPVASHEVSLVLDACKVHDAFSTPEQCVQGALAARWQLAAAARAAGIADSPTFLREKSDILSQAVLERLARQTPNPTDAEIESARGAARSEFDRPERVRIWRILVQDEAMARDLLAKLGTSVSPAAFRNLARDVSLDKATHERGGDLGFVAADGSTDVPEVSAEPALYAAAARLADGELAKQPVAEGRGFAIVWRRGTLPAIHGDDPVTREMIRQSLRRKRADLATRSLVTELKQRELKAWHPEHLQLLRGAGRLYPSQ